MSTFRLDGLHVAITGAAGGIGSASARLCAELGASLWLSDIAAPQETAAAVSALGVKAEAQALDVTDRDAVQSWAARCEGAWALIDCAAICPFDDWADPGWDEVSAKVFEVNLNGPINLCRAFMPALAARGGGRIALVGSIAGRIGGLRAAPHYVMSKGGIHSFVRWAAKRGAADNVLVNAVAPGVVDTPMTANQAFDFGAFPLGRKATAEELAAPLVFLISPAASYVSGAVLDVNGAMHFS